MKRFVIAIMLTILLTSCGNNNSTKDTTPPVIELIGDEVIYLHVGDDYVDPGAIATDNLDPNPELSHYKMKNVDTSTSGIYTVYFFAEDEAGNSAERVERTIYVLQNIPDIELDITVLDSDSIEIDVDEGYPRGVLQTLTISIYQDETLIETVEWDKDTDIYQIDGLTIGSTYEIQLTGTYDQGCDLGVESFELDSMSFNMTE